MARPARGKQPPRRPVGPLRGPPLGTYDPALNYQLRASERGLLDLIEDTTKERRRGSADYRTGRRIARRGYGRNLSDLQREYGRGQQDIGLRRADLGIDFARDLTDLAVARQRGEEDYQRTLAGLQRNYAALAFNQDQNALAQGVSEGGTAEASAQVRGANQAYERQGIDLEHARSLEDLARREGILSENFGTDTARLDLALQRLGQDAGINQRRLRGDFLTERRLDRREFRRGRADTSERLSRAKREQGLYEPSVIEQMYYQAHQLNPSIRFPRLLRQQPRVSAPAPPRPPVSGGIPAPRRRRR